MKKIFTLLFVLMLLNSFNTFSQELTQVTYNKIIVIDKNNDNVIEKYDLLTTLSFDSNNDILVIESPIIDEIFYIESINLDSDFYYLNIICVQHDVDFTIVSTLDGSKVILYDFDEFYYYVLTNE